MCWITQLPEILTTINSIPGLLLRPTVLHISIRKQTSPLAMYDIFPYPSKSDLWFTRSTGHHDRFPFGKSDADIDPCSLLFYASCLSLRRMVPNFVVHRTIGQTTGHSFLLSLHFENAHRTNSKVVFIIFARQGFRILLRFYVHIEKVTFTPGQCSPPSGRKVKFIVLFILPDNKTNLFYVTMPIWFRTLENCHSLFLSIPV